MDSCCTIADAPVAAPPATLCPDCRTRGRVVGLSTVKSLLTERALARVHPSATHRFCPYTPCRVVYFDSDGTVYTTDDVRVAVWQKEPFGARLICYCFGETEAGLRSEIEERGRSEAVGRVREHVAAGRCACDARNPRGVCCLGDLAAAVRRVEAAVADATPDVAP